MIKRLFYILPFVLLLVVLLVASPVFGLSGNTLPTADGVTSGTFNHCQYRLPTANGASSGTWNPSTGANWSCVDDPNPTTTTGDADYMTGQTNASYQTFTFTAFSIPSTATVTSVQVVYRARENTTGTTSSGGRLVVNGTGYNSGTNNPGTTFTYYLATWTVNPASTVVWTYAEVNGGGTYPLQQFGIYGTTLATYYQRISICMVICNYTDSVASYYSDVDETTYDDTNYFMHTATTSGYKLFTFSSPSLPDGCTVANVTITYRVADSWNAVVGTNNIRSCLRIGGTNYSAADTGVDPTGNFTTRSYAYTTNPRTSAAWLEADVEGTGANPLQQFGEFSSDVTPYVSMSMCYMTVYYSPGAPTGVAATDGTYTDKVVVTWSKPASATGYAVYRGGVNDSGTLGDVATYDDTAGAAPTITPGTADATDGSSTSYVTLSVSGESSNVGATESYTVRATDGTYWSLDSTANTGYKGTTTLTYQWYRSQGTGDSAPWDSISAGTSDPYNDTEAPAPTISTGTAAATDGTYTTHVELSISGESANVGAVRWYYCVISMTGAASQDTTHNGGYRDVGSLGYQWWRSSADSDTDFSSLSGATYEPFDDTTAPANGDGRWYYCLLTATGATSGDTNHNRGYRATFDITNTPTSKVFGLVDESSTYYAKGTAPNNPVVDGDCIFTVTNAGNVAINITIKGSAFTGGDGWTLASGSPGSNTVRITTYYSGQNPASGVVLTTVDQAFISNLGVPGTKKWDFKLETGTFTDGVPKSGTITLTSTVY